MIASGAQNRPRVPTPLAGSLSSRLLQLHAADYRNAAALPDGAVLVAGAGQSGCQIAEDRQVGGAVGLWHEPGSIRLSTIGYRGAVSPHRPPRGETPSRAAGNGSRDDRSPSRKKGSRPVDRRRHL